MVEWNMGDETVMIPMKRLEPGEASALHFGQPPGPPPRPPVVCICGSVGKFWGEMTLQRIKLTKEGKIVIGPEVQPKQWEGDKTALDMLHFRKIDLATEVLVVDVDTENHHEPYIGQSTRYEICYAADRFRQGRLSSITRLSGKPLPSDLTMDPFGKQPNLCGFSRFQTRSESVNMNQPPNVACLEDKIRTVPDPTNPGRFLRIRSVVMEETTVEAVVDKDGKVEWEADSLKAMRTHAAVAPAQ